jgi:hypothetical protein
MLERLVLDAARPSEGPGPERGPVGRLPARSGLGLKVEHAADWIGGEPDVGFIEIHAENYLSDGGAGHRHLGRLRETYPISIHGVAMSIGAEAPLDRAHLDAVARLVALYRPASFSEHLAWSTHGEIYLNDLLPVAYDTPTLRRVADHVDEVQDRLGMPMLLENPSTYVEFTASTWDEVDFLSEVSRRTGCGLLLDVNNVQVTCTNHGRDPHAYLRSFPVERVGEVHLAGYAEDRDSLGDRLLIDTHDRPVQPDVWILYRSLIARAGPLPTLLEWDNDVPAFDVLLREASAIDAILDLSRSLRSRTLP